MKQSICGHWVAITSPSWLFSGSRVVEQQQSRMSRMLASLSPFEVGMSKAELLERVKPVTSSVCVSSSDDA
jgi:hypothetical protein